MGVVLGGVVAELLEGVAAVVEVTELVGLQLEFVCVNLGAVLGMGQVVDLGSEFVGVAVEAGDLGVEGVNDAPQERFALVGELGAVGGDVLGDELDGFAECVDGGGGVPDVAAVRCLQGGGQRWPCP